jgi:hypothetical protein
MHYIHVDTTLFTLLHSTYFRQQGAILGGTDTFHEQGRQIRFQIYISDQRAVCCMLRGNCKTANWIDMRYQ